MNAFQVEAIISVIQNNKSDNLQQTPDAWLLAETLLGFFYPQ